jgi:hypothetical protein
MPHLPGSSGPVSRIKEGHLPAATSAALQFRIALAHEATMIKEGRFAVGHLLGRMACK